MPIYTNQTNKFLIKIRFNHNQTQAEMAQFLGISTSLLSCVERQSRTFTNDLVDLIIGKYKLNLIDIYKLKKLQKTHNKIVGFKWRN